MATKLLTVKCWNTQNTYRRFIFRYPSHIALTRQYLTLRFDTIRGVSNDQPSNTQ